MVVRRIVACEIPFFQVQFRHTAFEDVDFQLRVLSAGYSVRFAPRLSVVHRHPLTLAQLWSKSLRSGRGIARCLRSHGAAFPDISRWAYRRNLLIRPIVYWGWIGLLLPIGPGATALGVVGILAALFEASMFGFAGFAAWLFVKPVRDLLILFGWIVADLAD